MKKKFSLWFNIATICLCVCAIAIGVYAAQSAILKVTGSIGFKANGIKYSATVEALGYVTDPEKADTYVSTLTKLTDVTDATESNTLSLGNLNFTDLNGETVPNIEIKVTVTNNSKFDVLVAPSTATCSGVDITSTDGGIAIKNGGTSASITYTLALNKDETTGEYNELSSTNNLSIEIDLKKFIAKTDTNGKEIEVKEYTTAEQSDIWDAAVGSVGNKDMGVSYVKGRDMCYAEKYPYYITMGSKDATAIRWLIVGYNNQGKLATLTNEDKAALAGKRLIKGKNYIALSAELLTTHAFLLENNYKSINDIYVNTKEAYKDLGVNASDYYASDIREYLNSDTFKNAFSLNDTSIKVTPRPVSELYAGKSVSIGKICTISQVGDSKDDFWLLDRGEESKIFSADPYTCKLSVEKTTFLGGDYSRPWWLRTPYYQYDDYAVWRVDYNNSYDYATGSEEGVRPAFQF